MVRNERGARQVGYSQGSDDDRRRLFKVRLRMKADGGG